MVLIPFMHELIPLYIEPETVRDFILSVHRDSKIVLFFSSGLSMIEQTFLVRQNDCKCFTNHSSSRFILGDRCRHDTFQAPKETGNIF